MTILLFDMDGVLLIANAYHRALGETVTRIGQALGYQKAGLTHEDIEVFESVGVTSEWLSSAICGALMLREVWAINPAATIPSAPPLVQLPGHQLSLPDFQAFFCSHEMVGKPGERAQDRAGRALVPITNGYTLDQVENLSSLLKWTNDIRKSIPHRIFQELVLGSQLFKESYGLEPSFNVDGYLQTEDLPTLDSATHKRLIAWLNLHDHYAAVFTLRPSKPPKDFFVTPEAEMGLKLIDLESIPVVGYGSVAWLAAERGVNIQELIKPSPIHALAAIRRSVGDHLEKALWVASDLVLEGKLDEEWKELDGAEIYVFEDSVTGFQSAKSAQKVLSEAGIKINFQLLGVSCSTMKQQALEAGGASQVFEDINQALDSVLK